MIVKGFSVGLLLTSLMLISACSQLKGNNTVSSNPVVKPAVQKSAWQNRQDFLSRRSAWNLNSKISLRYDDENWIFRLNWLQKPANSYEMRIRNPITGALVAKLARANGIVSLLSNNGRTFRDTDEERLLQQQSNVRLPVKGMQYWVRGLTSPQYKVDNLVLDNAGRPRSLSQAGWQIKFSSYMNNGFNALPRTIVMTRSVDKVYLKVVAKQWR